MAEFPAMPLWTDAYLADCGHLDDAETGRYMRILMMLWRAPRQRLPNDDGWLGRHFNRSIERVKVELRPLIEEFCTCDGNWISQKRLSREFDYLTGQRKAQARRAKARWENNSPENVRPIRVSDNPLKTNGTDTQSGNAPTPTPPVRKNQKARPVKGGGAPDDSDSMESTSPIAAREQPKGSRRQRVLKINPRRMQNGNDDDA